MNEMTHGREFQTDKEAQEHLRLQLAEYVKMQPEATQSFHRWMRRLEAAALGIIAAAFLIALYLSIVWKSINPILIPTAWFVFAASASPLAVLIGLHAIILKAFPPIIVPGKAQKFVTGSGATWTGFGIIGVGAVLAAFWGLFAYATVTQNWILLKPLIGFLGAVMGIGMAVSILIGMISTTIRKISKSIK